LFWKVYTCRSASTKTSLVRAQRIAHERNIQKKTFNFRSANSLADKRRARPKIIDVVTTVN
jgi:hypothetical protein